MEAGHVAINTYECCPNPYHFSLEGLASCSDETGFAGEIRVGALHVDDIEQDTDFNPSSAAFVGFQMNLVDKTLLKNHLKEQPPYVITNCSVKQTCRDEQALYCWS